MKLFYIILLIILSNYSIFGQLGKVDNKIAKQILKSETIVILSESDTNYNNLLRKTVERYWKITNFTYSLESDLKNINNRVQVTHIDSWQLAVGSWQLANYHFSLII